MNNITLESLNQRVEALERAIALRIPEAGKNTWRNVIGKFAGSEFMRQVDEEGQKLREAERTMAQQEHSAE
jgi:hypothetical protein